MTQPVVCLFITTLVFVSRWYYLSFSTVRNILWWQTKMTVATFSAFETLKKKPGSRIKCKYVSLWPNQNASVHTGAKLTPHWFVCFTEPLFASRHLISNLWLVEAAERSSDAQSVDKFLFDIQNSSFTRHSFLWKSTFQKQRSSNYSTLFFFFLMQQQQQQKEQTRSRPEDRPMTINWTPLKTLISSLPACYLLTDFAFSDSLEPLIITEKVNTPLLCGAWYFYNVLSSPFE